MNDLREVERAELAVALAEEERRLRQLDEERARVVARMDALRAQIAASACAILAEKSRTLLGKPLPFGSV
jgi:hypothetical protein